MKKHYKKTLSIIGLLIVIVVTFSIISMNRTGVKKINLQNLGFSFLGVSNTNQTLNGSMATRGCCCGGTGKKTLYLVIPGTPGTGEDIDKIIDEIPDNEKECVEIINWSYDDEMCPKDLAEKFKRDYRFYSRSGIWCKIVVVAHSQGGIIAGYAAGGLPGSSETHTLASPLNGVSIMGTMDMNTMWRLGYFFPPGASFIGDAMTSCMAKEVVNGNHTFATIGSGSSFTTHTSEPSNTFPLATQQAGPAGSTSQHHPGTTHESIIKQGFTELISREKCDCGNNVVDTGEQCDPPGSECTNNVNQKKTCNSECQCPTLCGNGVLDPGESCDVPPGEYAPQCKAYPGDNRTWRCFRCGCGVDMSNPGQVPDVETRLE